MTGLRRFTSETFRSMRSRNYRLYFYGQLISTSGTWMQTVALAWLVLQMTGSGFDVGLVTALQFLPMLVISSWGGVLADRLDKRRTLVVTQSGMAVCAAGLAAVTIGGVAQLWNLYLLTLASGCFNAIDNPVRQAFVSEMVGIEDLPNAVSLNSAMFNMSRIIGPALGALVIKVLGVGPCFALNAVSFVAVIAGLLMMRRDELFLGRPVLRAKGQIREGLRYVWANIELRSTILVMAVVGTLAFNFTVVLPLLAKFTFHGDATTYGLLTAIMGAGSLVGALATASWLRPTPAAAGCHLRRLRRDHDPRRAGADPHVREAAHPAARGDQHHLHVGRQLDLPADLVARDERPGHGPLRGGLPRQHADRRAPDRLDLAAVRAAVGHGHRWGGDHRLGARRRRRAAPPPGRGAPARGRVGRRGPARPAGGRLRAGGGIGSSRRLPHPGGHRGKRSRL